MQKKRIISLVFLALFVLSLAVGYINLPDSFVLYKDRNWTYDGIARISVTDKSIETSKNEIIPRNVGSYEASLSVLGIPCKKVNVKVLDDKKVIVPGVPIGIRLYSDGLVVVAVGRVNENKKSPAEAAGIKEGDVIVSVNGTKVGAPDEFLNTIANSENTVILGVVSGEEKREVTVVPEVSEYDKVKRIGLWVRDSTAGVGTLTFVDTDTMTYGALGHGVSDADTGVKFSVREGSVEECAIAEIKKGEKGAPGELKGAFLPDAKILGNITKNEKEGIFGSVKTIPKGETMPLGHKSEIRKGKAYIRTSLGGKASSDYAIEITKVSKNSKNPSKGFMIKVTDEKLIEKTGELEKELDKC
jgi:stage IV sporulation protein B